MKEMPDRDSYTARIFSLTPSSLAFYNHRRMPAQHKCDGNTPASEAQAQSRLAVSLRDPEGKQTKQSLTPLRRIIALSCSIPRSRSLREAKKQLQIAQGTKLFAIPSA